MASFFSPVGTQRGGRPMAPRLNQNKTYLSEVEYTPEGHYTTEAWPLELRGRISFEFFHLGIFHPPLVLAEQRFEDLEKLEGWWTRHAQLFPTHSYQSALAQRFCTPVIKRDAAIQKVLKDIGWEAERGVRRVRKGERYLVYFEKVNAPCPHWFVNHTHACQLTVVDPRNRQIIKDVYDCDHVWQGVCDYVTALKDFDNVHMENIL